jgi:hypothetical protein
VKKIFTIENSAFVGDSIPMNGKLPQNGTIILNQDGSVRIAVSDGSLCAYKNEYEDEVNLGEMTIAECLSTVEIEYTADSCFSFDENTRTITDYDLNGCPSDIVIPNKINNVPVEHIRPGAFINATEQWCADEDYYYTQVDVNYIHTSGDGYIVCEYEVGGGPITSVIFPQTLKTIGYGAFNSNQISNLRIPNSVTEIGEYAFYNNQIINLSLPKNLSLLSDGVFGVNDLTTIKIPNSVVKIGDFALYYNQISNITIPNSVNHIGYYALSGNQLQTISIPNSVTIIESCAFCYNELTSIEIPSSVTRIDGFAFNDNQLPDSQAFIYARNLDGTINNTKIISYGGSRRSNVVIPSGVVTIGEWAFFGNNITSITIPSSVRTIERGAFSYNYLTNVTIPNGITTIGTEAFYENVLTSIALPNSVTTIGNRAFRYNRIPQGSATIDRAQGTVTVGSNAFANNGIDGKTTITLEYLR